MLALRVGVLAFSLYFTLCFPSCLCLAIAIVVLAVVLLFVGFTVIFLLLWDPLAILLACPVASVSLIVLALLATCL